MNLTWAEIDARWPGSSDPGGPPAPSVVWDRDVAPTLDWEPRFVEGRHGVRFDEVTLWAVDVSQRCGPEWIRQLPSPNDRGRRAECHCRAWVDGEWITHLDWEWRGYEAERRWWDFSERDRITAGTGRIFMAGTPWLDEFHRIDSPRSDMADAIIYAAEHVWRTGLRRHPRWPTLRRVLGANRPP